MTRLRRWLFNFTACVSLVICFAAMALWVHSHSFRSRIVGDLAKQHIAIQSVPGRLVIDRLTYLPHQEGRLISMPLLYEEHLSNLPPGIDLAQTDHHFLGFGYGFSAALNAFQRSLVMRASNLNAGLAVYPLHRLVVPYWAIVVFAAVLPGLWVRNFLSRRRALCSGLCPVCGYDLRATPDRCPECGTVPEAAKGAAT